MKRKFYSLLIALCVLGFGNIYAQDTLHVGENLNQMMIDAPDGDTIIVKQGVHNAQRAALLIQDKSLTLMGEEGDTKPVVYIKQIDLDGTVGTVNIEGIEFSGMTYDSINSVEDTVIYPDNGYFVNFASSMVSCAKLNVENCIIRNIDTCCYTR